MMTGLVYFSTGLIGGILIGWSIHEYRNPMDIVREAQRAEAERYRTANESLDKLIEKIKQQASKP